MSNAEIGKESAVSRESTSGLSNRETDPRTMARSEQHCSGISTNCMNAPDGSFGVEGLAEVEGFAEESKSPDVDSFSNVAAVGTALSTHGASAGDFASNGINSIGIPNTDESDKHFTLRFSIPIPQAGPRPTSSIHGSAYSTPGTFSISSRGCTSTAPSTAPSTCSLNDSESSLNEKGAAGSFASSVANKSKAQSQTGSANSASAMRTRHSTSSGTQGLCDNGSNNAPSVGGSPSSTAGISTAGNNTDNETNVDRIDSALLSALCDPREKYGLLRLEQTLIDFMNERTTGYIEVGGPNNSIVIGGQSGGRLSNGSASIGTSNLNGVSNNGEIEGRSGKQTSFQRLCLHRLADRFNIVRESASNTSTWTPPSSNTPSIDDSRSSNLGISSGTGSSVPGLIRLVKVKNSRIPQNLLIDLDVSSYQCSNPTNMSPSNVEAKSNLLTREKTSDAVKDITDNFAATAIESKASVTFVKKQSSQPRQKMRIMKRNSSNGSLKSNASNDRKRGHKKNANNLKGKKLSDKEKAYAEARARIFNESIASCDNAENGEKQNIGRDVESSASQTFSQQVSASPSSSAAPSEIEDDSDLITRNTSNQNDGVNEIAEGENENSSTSTSRSYVKETQNPQTATKVTSKVTWRNRRQEENDPDFWRGFNRNTGMHPQYAYGPSTSGPGFVNGASTTVQSNGYSHHGMMQQHHPGSQMFYPSESHSRLPYNANVASNGGHYAQYTQQTPNYYGNHTKTTSYYPQQQQPQHHQLRQNFHNTSNGNGGSYVSSSSTSHIGICTNSDAGGESSNPGSGRRGKILYNMEEFPALR